MFETIESLLERVHTLTLEQPSEFQDTLSYVCESAIDPNIRELMDIVLNTNEGIYLSSTHI